MYPQAVILKSLTDGFVSTPPRPDGSRERLALRPLLVIAGNRRLLVDPGLGDWPPTAIGDGWHRDEPTALDQSLRAAGLEPTDITDVILTHLHIDHCGGTLTGSPAGTSLRFPRARHFVQRREWDHAVAGAGRRHRSGYHPTAFLPLAAAGVLELVDGDAEPAPGITLRLTPGHTPGFQLVLVQANGVTAACLSDLLPTGSRVATPYIIGYDSEPRVTMQTKARLFEQAASEQWLCLPPHDPAVPAGTIELVAGRPVWRPKTVL